MFNYSKILIIGLIAGALCSGLSAQQAHGIGWRTIEQVGTTNAWLSSVNAAGLYTLSSIRMSLVEGYAGKKSGDFVNYGSSDNSLKLGAVAESFYRLNSTVVFYGLLDYNRFTGKNMAGSYFIDPDDAPFNIVEYSDDNRGEKEMEHYHLTGAVSVDLSEKIVLGAKLNYIVANYAKMKDLRHKSELMDLDAAVGVVLRLAPRFDLGISATYRRRVEGVYIDMYGTTDKTYNSLIDYGAFWGKKEQFGENGYTSDGEEKPLADNYYGVSFQTNWIISDRLHWFNELSACVRDGYYGKKSPSTVVFSEHSGVHYSYKGRLSLLKKNSEHFFNVATLYKEVENCENIYRYDNEGGGLTNVNYYGELETSGKKYFQAQVGYAGHWAVVDDAPQWVTIASLTYLNRDIKASIYPYYRKQQLHRYVINVATERMIYCKNDAYTFRLGATYQKGGGEPFEDRMYSSTTTSGNTPKSMSLYLMQEYEYMTNAAVKGEAGFKYTRRISDSGMRVYISFTYGYTKAFDVTYLQGSSLNDYQFKIGCTF